MKRAGIARRMKEQCLKRELLNQVPPVGIHLSKAYAKGHELLA